MTEQECIKWVQENLPFAMKSKKGKLQYPFKAAYYAREIEQCLGKSLYKLLAGHTGYKREFNKWCIEYVIVYPKSKKFAIVQDCEEIEFDTTEALYEYWKTEIKSTNTLTNESLK